MKQKFPALVITCEHASNAVPRFLAQRIAATGEAGIPALVKEKSFSAGMLRIALQTENGEEIIASRHGIDAAVAPGDSVVIRFSPEAAAIVEAEDEKP